jgi:hypothetical protein
MTFTSNILSQNDPRWQNQKLGFHATETIGQQGCALTCLSMMATGYGYSITPDKLNEKLIDLGPGNGYVSSLMVWAGMTRLYPKIGIKEVYVCSDVKPVPLERIDSLLGYGQAVLVEIDSSLVTGEQSHWVLLTEKIEDDYIMLDPLKPPAEETTRFLVDQYGFGRPVDQLITSVAFYECWETGDGEPVIPALPGMFVQVLASTTKGLRMRVQPETSASIVTVEIARTPLLVLEDETKANSKVGVTDQWIKVRDPQGFEGYVAAWFLEECRMPEVEEIAVPVVEETPPPDSLVEPDISEELNPPAPVVNPVPESQPKPPIPQSSVPEITPETIYVSSDVAGRGLRLRAQPNLEAKTVTVLEARQKLEIVEDAAAARDKVGIINQWINVRTDKGESGFCAAWLLVLPVSHQITQISSTGVSTPIVEVDPFADTRPTPVVKVEPAPDQELTDKVETTSQPKEPDFTVIVSKNVGKVGLRLRTTPVDGNVILVMKAETELTVLEPWETAHFKIGVKNEWLHVKNEEETSGFAAAWYLEPGKQPEVVNPANETPTDLVVNVSPVVGTGGLRLRSAPNLESPIVKKLPPLTPLVVLEPVDAARPKIGMMDQWLNVSTSDGSAGYVAAWYVVN